MRRGTNATRSSQLAARSTQHVGDRRRSLCAYYRIGHGPTFTQARHVWKLAFFWNVACGAPFGNLPLFSSFAGPASLSSTQWTLLGRLPTPSPCSAVLPRSPFIRRGHQLGAPNSRVTKDAPLAWLGRARLLGAQMMYIDHFCLSSSLALAHAAVTAFAFRALLPRTYAQARSTGRRNSTRIIKNKEKKSRRIKPLPKFHLLMYDISSIQYSNDHCVSDSQRKSH